MSKGERGKLYMPSMPKGEIVGNNGNKVVIMAIRV
jgi:hypothetical protein